MPRPDTSTHNPAAPHPHSPSTHTHSAIYTHDAEQRAEAQAKVDAMRAALDARAPETRGWAGRRIVTPVEPAVDYFIAEAYHQQVGV